MTPYELRFEIFKQAYNFSLDKFSTEMDTARTWNEDARKTVMMDYPVDYPEFPTYQEVEELADKINNFVSSK